MTSDEILELLAEQTDSIGEFFGVTFQVLEGYWAICDARLSAFSSDKMWAVAVEVVGYDPGADQYANRVWLLGNCLEERGDWYLADFEREIFTVPTAWNLEIEPNQIWGIARSHFALRWRGKRLDFAPSLDDLGAAKIELSRREIETGELTPQQMLRFVCEKLDHPFFLSEDALRDLLNEKAIPFEHKYDKETGRNWYQNALGEFDEPPYLSTYLELLLQTRDWIHPKAGLGDAEAGEWEISPHQAFGALSQLLATRDLALWEAQDKTRFNSHWRYWAEIEAEKEREQSAAIAAGKAAFRAYLEGIPADKRAAWVENLRPTIADAPSFNEWGNHLSISVGEDGKGVRIFRELLQEPDAI